MLSSRLTHRVTGTAIATLMLTAGAVAIASPAAAKANTMTVDRIALDTRNAPVIKAYLTYSCDPGSDVHVTTTATNLDTPDGSTPSIATTTLPNDKLICDAARHVERLTLSPQPGAVFQQGDDVKVVATIVNPAGVEYAQDEKIATL
ncbi:hypothetical protein [Streptomyces celluloflavus]|uniref:hypothetical protein n=1 Tax=Streptomyces celluloflavus TaxID=58344 RepID=UPI003693A5E5